MCSHSDAYSFSTHAVSYLYSKKTPQQPQNDKPAFLKQCSLLVLLYKSWDKCWDVLVS